ncbi:MAG TPA: carboxypeptidase-like regulatory domain-containing protein, partial [Anseongella sp.]|nr:carboxypeptidase-like regulatory domain-containing protein [Anseongella sp.]
MKHKKVFSRGLLLAFLCTIQAEVFAQTAVTGKVTSETGEVLPGVNVVVKGTSTGVVTDQEGDYSITVPGENSILVYSFIGMTTREVSVNGRSVIDIELAPDIGTLVQAVVVSYGTQREREITGSIQQLNAEE